MRRDESRQARHRSFTMERSRGFDQSIWRTSIRPAPRAIVTATNMEWTIRPWASSYADRYSRTARRPSRSRTPARRAMPTIGPFATNAPASAMRMRALRSRSTSAAASSARSTTITSFVDDQPRDGQLLVEADRIRGANVGPRRGDSLREAVQDSWLAGGGGSQMDRVDSVEL